MSSGGRTRQVKQLTGALGGGDGARPAGEGLLPVVTEPRAATDAHGREGRKKVVARTEGLEEPRAGLFCSKRSQEMGGEDEMVELSSELKRLMAVIYWAKPENRRTWKARREDAFPSASLLSLLHQPHAVPSSLPLCSRFLVPRNRTGEEIGLGAWAGKPGRIGVCIDWY